MLFYCNSKLKYTNQIDQRDNSVLPTKGGFLKSSVEVAGAGGDVKFVRANFDYQYTKTLFEHFVNKTKNNKQLFCLFHSQI